MYKHNRLDFIETDLKSSIVEKCASDLDTIKSMEIEFEHHKNRLSVVRQEKEQKRLDLLGKINRKLGGNFQMDNEILHRIC